MPQRVMPVTIIPSSPTPHTLPIRRITCPPCGRHSTAWRAWDTGIVRGNLPEIGPALVQGPPRAARSSWYGCCHIDGGLLSLAGATEQAALQVRIWRVGAEPDGQKGGREVIACDRTLHRAAHPHLDAGTRLVDEDQSLAALDIHHPALEHRDALVQRRELLLGIVLKALLPGLLEFIVADVVQEVEDQLLGGVRREQRLRIAGDVRHVERSDIDIDLQKRRLTQAETVERQRTTIDLRLLREVDALAVLAVRHPKAKRCEHTYQHQEQTAFHTCFLT